MKVFDVTALGEILIDFTPHGLSAGGNRLFEQNPGGAPANVVCAISKLGLRGAFIGKVGADMHGAFLKEVLETHHVDTSGLMMDEAFFTTLAFVTLSETGDRDFSFARQHGADKELRIEELPLDILEQTKILHVGSLSLTDEPARSATRQAIKTAKAAGAWISYDPNYRPLLWKNTEAAVIGMKTVLADTDIIKCADNEIELLAGTANIEQAATVLLASGISVVLITRGEHGAYFASHAGKGYIPACPCNVVDTTGAGDSFFGAFLYQLLRSEKTPKTLTREDLQLFCTFASKAASVCCSKRGAIPALPELNELVGSAVR